ncbi:unnamed protein product [Rhizoctonia solani]|uniref:Pseudouridine synthase I TruA alpha/beta domain-containing protein n=1 Tax=Rhizoctonia solani TaxID=456999 RepID=A0A8H3H975_9AGAM|nr:unnamed protein product [Rhizoctonia solani]
MASAKSKLEDLSKEQLIARIYELERQLPPQSRRSTQSVQNPFPFSQHPIRKIALKFTYAGWLYNGLAAQSQPTPLPTVEQVLFDALANTRLVDPEKGMEGCGWSRCGRTDRGVSSAGQVVGLWVRSALGAGSVRKKNESVFEQEDSSLTPGLDVDPTSALETVDLALPVFEPSSLDVSSPPAPSTSPPSAPITKPDTKQATKETKQELAYIHMLNRVLPPTIRVLAWSPVADDFDARFSCQWRHYKYFFSRGGRALDGLAGAAVGRIIKGQGRVGEGEGGAGDNDGGAEGAGLDITAMREAATRLIGEHDFRNFCKLDPSKQIENFNRRVLGAWIERVGDDHGEGELGSEATESNEDLYVFNLKGTAFLWHQVRCIMAILFLVGQRLEHPSIIDNLLHTSHSSSKALTSAPIESKPNYILADSLPLVLWDCGYKPEDATWQTDAIAQTKQGVAQDRERTNNFWFNMYSIWTHDRIQTTMQMYFLRAAERFYPTPSPLVDREWVRLNTGGGVYRHSTRYVPIHELERGERAEVANAKWSQGTSGQRRMAKRNTKTKIKDDD